MKYTKIGWISKLYYEYGKQQDLYFQIHDKEYCTTWKHFLEVQTNDWWLNHVNHRTLLNCEIVLDFDDVDAEVQFHKTIRAMDKSNKRYIAYHGTYHIHVYDDCMFHMTKREREEYRLKFIEKFNADKMKASNRCMIALEYAPHWKRGTVKVPLAYNGGMIE